MKGRLGKLKVFFKKNKTLFYILVILAVSLYPRLWMLSQKPLIIVDEAANLRDIEKIKSLRIYNPNDFHWDFSSSQLSYAPVLLLSGLFPKTDLFFLLRMTSVIISLLSLAALFFLLVRYSNETIAFFTTLLFSLSYYFLQFSRVGWTEIILAFTSGLFLILSVEKAISTLRLRFSILAGFLAGLVFHNYRAGIIYIVVSLFYLIFSLYKKDKSLHVLIRHIAAFFFIFFLVTLAWLHTAFSNFDKYMLRPRVVSIKSIEFPYHGLNSRDEVVKYQLITTIRSWLLLQAVNSGGHEGPRYLPLSVPPLNILVRVTFWLGLVFIFFEKKLRAQAYVWIAVLILGMLGQIITVDPPNGARALVMLPSYYVISSICVSKIYELSKKSKLVLAGILVLTTIFSSSDFFFYQFWMTWIKV